MMITSIRRKKKNQQPGKPGANGTSNTTSWAQIVGETNNKTVESMKNDFTKGDHSPQMEKEFREATDYTNFFENEFEIQFSDDYIAQFINDKNIRKEDDCFNMTDEIISRIKQIVFAEQEKAGKNWLKDSKYSSLQQLNSELNEDFFLYYALKSTILTEKQHTFSRRIFHTWLTNDHFIEALTSHYEKEKLHEQNKNNNGDKTNLENDDQNLEEFLTKATTKLHIVYRTWLSKTVFKETNNSNFAFKLNSTKDFGLNLNNTKNFTAKLLAIRINFKLTQFQDTTSVIKHVLEKNSWKKIGGPYLPTKDISKNGVGGTEYIVATTEESNPKPFLGDKNNLRINIINSDITRCTNCNSLEHKVEFCLERCAYCYGRKHRWKKCAFRAADQKRVRNNEPPKFKGLYSQNNFRPTSDETGNKSNRTQNFDTTTGKHNSNNNGKPSQTEDEDGFVTNNSPKQRRRATQQHDDKPETFAHSNLFNNLPEEAEEEEDDEPMEVEEDLGTEQATSNKPTSTKPTLNSETPIFNLPKQNGKTKRSSRSPTRSNRAKTQAKTNDATNNDGWNPGPSSYFGNITHMHQTEDAPRKTTASGGEPTGARMNDERGKNGSDDLNRGDNGSDVVNRGEKGSDVLNRGENAGGDRNDIAEDGGNSGDTRGGAFNPEGIETMEDGNGFDDEANDIMEDSIVMDDEQIEIENMKDGQNGNQEIETEENDSMNDEEEFSDEPAFDEEPETWYDSTMDESMLEIEETNDSETRNPLPNNYSHGRVLRSQSRQLQNNNEVSDIADAPSNNL